MASRTPLASLPLALLLLAVIFASFASIPTAASPQAQAAPTRTAVRTPTRTTTLRQATNTQLATTPSFTFPTTGQQVSGQFLTYWQSNGGLPNFGYPISAVLNENGFQVQYFERQRFEFHPEAAGTLFEVLLGRLGDDMAKAQGRNFAAPVAANASSRTGRYFAETKRLVSNPFLTYWQAQGSTRALRIYGLPISDEFVEGELIVQYFERARFERPLSKRNPTTTDVELALLGTQYYKLTTKAKDAPPIASQPTATLPPPAAPQNTVLAQPTATAIVSNTPQPTATNTPIVGDGGYPYLRADHVGGGVIAQVYGQDKEMIMNRIKGGGFNWVKQQILWKDTEYQKGQFAWGELDNIVVASNEAGVKLMINVDKAPAWSRNPEEVKREPDGYPINADDMADFMAAMAFRYKGRIQAYEIWNEGNLHNEAGRKIDPGFYVEMLAKSYKAVKANDPNAVVILGAASPTGIINYDLAVDDVFYTEELFKYKDGMVKNFYDVLGVHPYGYNNPPETLWPDQPSPAKEFKTHSSFYFRRVEQIRAVQEKYGDGHKQIWVTEYGWCSDIREGGFGGCEETSQNQVADYLVRANLMARQRYPWMGPMFLWNLNFSTFLPWYDGPSHFSLFNPDWTPRPAYSAMHDLLTGSRPKLRYPHPDPPARAPEQWMLRSGCK